MQYLGGKSRTRDRIAGYLNHIRNPDQPYWEPFVGAGWVLEKIKGGPRFASDINPYLVAMWQALQADWRPPGVVTEVLYQAAHKGLCDPALTSFIGFGCSFGGKWFAGYARGNTSALSSKNSLLQKLGGVRTASFFVADFLTTPPPAPNCLIYCDPPYLGTESYEGAPPFDHSRFWKRVRQLERQGHTVIVSEYQAPKGFSIMLEMPIKTEMRTTASGRELRIERLFRLGQHIPLQPSLLPTPTQLELGGLR